MSRSELDAAWDAALDAPREDQSPWRVLADMLLSEGNPQGELMQLELDLELGRLRGLARGRYPGLKEDVERGLLPPGQGLHDAVFHRGALMALAGSAPHLTGLADDQRWRSVRRLSLHYAALADRDVPAPKTPLAGGRLLALETLGELSLEALELLGDAPPKPRLRSLRVVSAGHRAASRWAKAWPRVLAANPPLQEVRLAGSRATPDGAVARLFEEWLEPLAAAPLARVTVAIDLELVGRALAWRRRQPTSFDLFADVGVGRQLVELRADELVLHSPTAALRAEEVTRRERHLAGAAVDTPDTETLLVLNWRRDGGGPPPIRWAPAPT